ncbi:MAG: PIN domain-containing protein [Candidatus Atabeyarchaeum deiterrae]
MKVCIDTSVFIAVKNTEADAHQCEKILDAVDDKEIEGVVSSIVIAETLVGFYKNKEEKEAEDFLTHVTQSWQVSLVDLQVADRAARLRADQKMKLPDAIILASAEIVGAECFVTKDDMLRKGSEIQSLSPTEFVRKYLR